MDILIIGGTTFFGQDIVDLALAAGHSVTLFSRGNRQPEFWDRIKHIAGDRTDQVDFAGKLAGRKFDVVVDNVVSNGDDVRSALNVFRGNVGRYVLTSSVAIYIGLSNLTLPIAEHEANFDVKNREMPCAPTPTPEGFVTYALGKIDAERVLLEQNDLPYTIVRPPSVAGPEDPTERCQFYFQRLLDGGPLILTNGGVHIHQLIYRRDLARGYLAAMTSDKAINQIYHFANDKAVRLVDWVCLAAELLGVKADVVNIPAKVLHQSSFSYGEPWSHTHALTFDLSKVRADLGFKSTPMKTWLAETTAWYKEEVYQPDAPQDRERQAEIAFARKFRQLTAGL